MGEYNFLPMWYRNHIEQRKKFKYSVCSIILFLLSLFCVIRYFINDSYIKSIEDSIQENIYINEENERKNKLLYRERYMTIDTLINFNNTISVDYTIEDIYISEKDIILESHFSNLYTLTKFIKDLEEKRIYKIKKLDLEKLKEDNFICKVSLEVNNYDKEN
jgi:hypothetical protein